MASGGALVAEDTLGRAMLVARIVTILPPTGMDVGAMYRPFASIDPLAAPPNTCHVTNCGAPAG
jgi:hypothetical protein